MKRRKEGGEEKKRGGKKRKRTVNKNKNKKQNFFFSSSNQPYGRCLQVVGGLEQKVWFSSKNNLLTTNQFIRRQKRSFGKRKRFFCMGYFFKGWN